MNYIISSIENGVGIITINRPEKLNALNKDVLHELSNLLDQWQIENDIRVIILTGAGEKSFVAGADISEFPSFGLAEGENLARIGQSEVFDKIEFYNKPIIAAVNGFALGGGCELAMACHFRVASANAKFGQPEVNLGLIPGYGGTQRLPHLIGKGRALELLMTGDIIDAQTALNYGLVNHVYEAEELIIKALELAKKIVSKAPLAISKMIQCVNSAIYDTNREGYEIEIKSFGASFETEDAQEGVAAFLEKRKPVFSGK